MLFLRCIGFRKQRRSLRWASCREQQRRQCTPLSQRGHPWENILTRTPLLCWHGGFLCVWCVYMMVRFFLVVSFFCVWVCLCEQSIVVVRMVFMCDMFRWFTDMIINKWTTVARCLRWDRVIARMICIRWERNIRYVFEQVFMLFPSQRWHQFFFFSRLSTKLRSVRCSFHGYHNVDIVWAVWYHYLFTQRININVYRITVDPIRTVHTLGVACSDIALTYRTNHKKSCKPYDLFLSLDCRFLCIPNDDCVPLL